jgi:hypothetical protein
LRGQRAVEEIEGCREDRDFEGTEGNRRDRGRLRGQRAVEETERGREDRWLLRKQRVIERIQGCRENRAP